MKGGKIEVKAKSCTVFASTWSTNNIHLAGEGRSVDIRDCVKDLVRHFIKVYLSARLEQEPAFL
jgi:hypothetical protein